MLAGLGEGERRFVFHDVGFLDLYWKSANDSQRDLLKAYVNSRRLEVLGCSVSMNDYLLPKDADIQDNFVSGRKWWESRGLGPWSRTAWTIDSFGMQSRNPAQLRKLGIDHLVLSRVPYTVKNLHIVNRLLVFDWLDPRSGHSVKSAFTPQHYNGWKNASSAGKWVFEDPFGEKFNILELFLQFVVHHMDFEATVGSYEKLIAFNRYNPLRSEGFHIVFSTATEYFQDLVARNFTFSQETPSLSPYIDEPKKFWVGFYSSRPTFKYKVASFLSSWRSLKELVVRDVVQLAARSSFKPEQTEAAELLFDEVHMRNGILVHHDAITGTSTPAVIKHYSSLISRSQSMVQTYLFASSLIRDQLRLAANIDVSRMKDFYLCNWEPHKWCIFAVPKEGHSTVSMLFNPRHRRNYTYEIVAPDSNFEVFDSEGLPVQSHMSCLESKSAVNSYKRCKLTFQSVLEPNSFTTHRIMQVPQRSADVKSYEFIKSCKQIDLNSEYSLKLACTKNPFLLEFTQKKRFDFSLLLLLREYRTTESGHYIFRPGKGNIHASRFLAGNRLQTIAVAHNPHLTEVKFMYIAGTISLIFRATDARSGELHLQVEYDMRTEDKPTLMSNLKTNATEEFTGKEYVIDIRTNHTKNDRFYYSQNGAGFEEEVRLPKFKTNVMDEVDEYGLNSKKSSLRSPSRRERHALRRRARVCLLPTDHRLHCDQRQVAR